MRQVIFLFLFSCMIHHGFAYAQEHLVSAFNADQATMLYNGNASKMSGSDETGSLPAVNPKSKRKAFFYSLIVPGLGDLYLKNWKVDHWGSGKYFFASEVLLLSSFLYMRSYSDWTKSDARAFASKHAGVLWNFPKPMKYATIIGKFSDIYAYNETQRRLSGTVLLMDENERNYWKWDSEKNRKKYDKLRIRSQSSRTYATYTIYGILVNHLLSAVNTTRTFHIMSRQQTVDLRLMYVNNITSNDRYHGLVLSVSGH